MPGLGHGTRGFSNRSPLESFDMHALLTLFVYLTPFVIIGIAAKRFMAQHGVNLAAVRAEGDPARKRSRFLLGIWRTEPE